MAIDGREDGRKLTSGPGGYNEGSSADELLLRSRVRGDAFDRFQVTVGGTIYTGDGTTRPTGSYLATDGSVALGVQSVLASQSVADNHGPFVLTIDNSATFSGSSQTFRDPTAFIGWNHGRPETDSAALYIAMEQDYWTNTGFDGNWHHQCEFHVQYVGLTNNVRRVFSSSMNWTDDEVSTSILGDEFTVAKTDGTQVINWAQTGGLFFKLDTNIQKANAGLNVDATSGTAHLYLNYVAGQTARVHFQRAGVDIWQIPNTDGGSIQFYDVVNGVVPLTLVAGAAPTTGRIEHRVIDKWVDAGLFQTTVGSAGGASALPATPTKYLKILDSAGTTLIVPCYAAS